MSEFVRRTDVVTLSGMGSTDPSGGPIPSDRRSDTKHIILPQYGMSGPGSKRYDVNSEIPYPVYGADVSLQGDGALHHEYQFRPGYVGVAGEHKVRRPY